MEDAGTNEQPSTKHNMAKGACNPELNINSALFTVGIPESCLDALPERKSFRDRLHSLPSQPSVPFRNLCLSCGQVGHLLNECPNPTVAYLQPLDWTTATPVRAGDEMRNAEQKSKELCSRCEGLTVDLSNTANHIEKAWPREFTFNDFERATDWITLGPAASLLFQADCAFCRLLFSITQCPIDGSEELILTKTDSSRRLGASRFSSAGNFSACAYTTIKPTETAWNKSSVVKMFDQDSDKAMDAISYLSKDCLKDNKSPLSLGGRLVDRFSVNESILRGWLQRCEELHGQTCSSDYWDELRGIRLVDIVSRRIVPYPSDERCDYIALSYVWGKCEQRSYTLGSHVEKVPQTIEDAMTVTKVLGKRYLWVDSLTIDQSDSEHKATQIKLMSSIYRGAWATIVALSGRSAASGLPRVNTGKKLHPDVIFPQTSATLGGIQIVSTMPTLAQQLKISLWNTRAWTFQEALLSPRCLYFTQHQVYFQCNTLQCCESIDDTTLPSDDAEFPELYKIETGVLQSNFLRPSKDESMPFDIYRSDRLGLEKYYELLGIYSTRQMTSKLDRINAFSGILQALESLYFEKYGFYYGLPISALPWSLLWDAECTKPINGFPSWSWAGWETSWMYGGQAFVSFKKDIHTYLKIHKAENGSLVRIYDSSFPNNIDTRQRLDLLDEDPLQPLTTDDAMGPLFSSSFPPGAKVSSLLFIEGMVLSFACPSPAERIEDRTDWELNWKYDERDLELGGVKCSFRYLLTLENALRARLGQPQTFLVIARDLYAEKLTYWLLLLDEVDGIMYRYDQVRLSVPYSENYCINRANPRQVRLVLG